MLHGDRPMRDPGKQLSDTAEEPKHEPADELAYVYPQEEQPRIFAHPLSELQQHQQYYTSIPPPAMAPPNPFHPSQSSSFPFFGGPAALPGPSFGRLAFKNEPGQPSSSNMLSFSGQPPRTLSFSAGDDWPNGIEAVPQQVSERRSRPHVNAQEHVIAERRRREKMQQQFFELATIVPDLTKTDKISILGSAVEYVKQLEEKVSALKEQSTTRASEPHRVSSDNDASWTNKSASSDAINGPTVEARIHGDSVLLKICCNEKKGVLVMVYSEVENQGLSIINTSVLPFPDSCLSITITTKARLLVLHSTLNALDSNYILNRTRIFDNS
ncbi:hypothetical protein EJB05_43151, partial [Eragrostis curvula]